MKSTVRSMAMSFDLEQLAKTVMKEKGLAPEFSSEAIAQAENMTEAASIEGYKDYRNLRWCSIDNVESKDLDQLTFVNRELTHYQVWVAVADVDALVFKDSSLDQQAQINTTSVYTPVKVFPMLPEKLSTNLTSLGEGADRLALVVKIAVDFEGKLQDYDIERAVVRNHAKLNYLQVSKWLSDLDQIPGELSDIALWENLKIQNQVAQLLRKQRFEEGALLIETREIRSHINHNHNFHFEVVEHLLAHQLIEEFMIAANRSMADFFSKNHILSLRRIVKVPKNWSKIVLFALKYGVELPSTPESKALDNFLLKMKAQYPESFPDVSLAIVKLLGRGEYAVVNQNTPSIHFGLALSNYTHTTAPNRRYPDLICHRQFKAFLLKMPPPYSLDELELLAAHCTKQEDSAAKVERQLNKSAAALSLVDHIGQEFQGIITGVDEKNIWIRLFHPLVEGKVVKNLTDLDIGDRVSVRLIHIDIIKGHIDFSFIKKDKPLA